MARAKLHVVTPLVNETSSSRAEASDTAPSSPAVEVESTRRPTTKPAAKSPSRRPAAKGKMAATVADIMTTNVECCGPRENLDAVARQMWDRDVGVIVVVDENQRPLSVVTDRDLAMAAYTQGQPLACISVGSCMARELETCKATEPLAQALLVMQTRRVRRVPVVDEEGKLAGVVGLTDVVRALAKKKPSSGVTSAQVVSTLSSILG